jgi:hypothetical protein
VPRLGREILAVLAVKALALLAIWWLWFSAPEAKHMQLPPQQVQHRLVPAPAAQSGGAPPSSTAGNHGHASH